MMGCWIIKAVTSDDGIDKGRWW